MLSVLRNLRFVRNRPDLVLRGATNTFRVLAGRPRLRSLDLDLTYRCPCKCEQCYSDNYLERESEQLTVAEIADYVRQAVTQGALQVNLTGGEPLLRRDLVDIVAACRAEGVLVSMCTSGVELTRERLSALADAGLGLVIFSIDRASAESHDKNRGIPGLFDRVLDLIDHARALGMNVVVNTVATKAKLDRGELEEIRRLVSERGAMLNLTIPTPSGRWQDQPDVLLDDEGVERLFRFLDKPGVRTDTDGRYDGRGCPAGDQKLTIGAYGEVRACQLVPQTFGNVRAEPLARIWDRLRREPIAKSRQRLCPAADPAFRVRNPSHFGGLEPLPRVGRSENVHQTAQEP